MTLTSATTIIGVMKHDTTTTAAIDNPIHFESFNAGTSTPLVSI